MRPSTAEVFCAFLPVIQGMLVILELATVLTGSINNILLVAIIIPIDLVVVMSAVTYTIKVIRDYRYQHKLLLYLGLLAIVLSSSNVIVYLIYFGNQPEDSNILLIISTSLSLMTDVVTGLSWTYYLLTLDPIVVLGTV